ncbi:hypothetical protein GOV12_02415 [Candidatus Pacearchaeota archaeon]|nr:hypothetical protein [Candidatus Pacearchaeota archaeon]
MKYLVRVSYECDKLKDLERWAIINSDNPPRLGKTKNPILPPHDCRNADLYQSCDEDTSCLTQQILEIRSYSENERIKLKISKLELTSA